jgi:hypothetical protein
VNRFGAVLALAVVACGPPSPATSPKPAPATTAHVIEIAGRPRVAAIERGGDPATAVGVYAITEGMDGSDAPAVALGALLEARLTALAPRIVVTPGVVRVGLLVADPDAARDATARIAAALRAPYVGAPGERAAVERKLAVLATLPPARDGLALCERRLRAAGRPIGVAEVEAFRAAIVDRARVALGATGTSATAERVADALRAADAWGAGAAPPVPPLSNLVVDDATGPIPAGRARVTVAAWGAGDRASARARGVADPAVPLPGRLTSADATLVFGGASVARLGERACTSVTVEAAPAAVPNVIALARRELALAETDAVPAPIAEADPRDAAELAAGGLLAVGAPPAGGAIGAHVTLGGDRQAKTPPELPTLERDVAAASAALERPALDVTTALEPGQPESVVLVASPCGTTGESEDDAGLGALAVTAATLEPEGDVALEPFVAADGIGVLARGARRPGETTTELGRRVASALGRRLFVTPLPDSLAVARARATATTSDALAHLARTLVPKHPALVVPSGTADALLHASDGGAKARLEGLRRGPLRAAALVAGDADAARALATTLDRWVPRTFAGAPPACVDPGTPPAAKAGSWVKEGAPPEAWLAWPVGAADLPAARALARWLDRTALPRALDGLVRETSARVLGSARASFLVLHVATADGALDRAVAQARVLMDRASHGLSEADARAAIASFVTSERDAALDPRHRVVTLWRGAPALATEAELRAFAATLKDDALVVAAVRPRVAPSAGTGKP